MNADLSRGGYSKYFMMYVNQNPGFDHNLDVCIDNPKFVIPEKLKGNATIECQTNIATEATHLDPLLII